MGVLSCRAAVASLPRQPQRCDGACSQRHPRGRSKCPSGQRLRHRPVQRGRRRTVLPDLWPLPRAATFRCAASVSETIGKCPSLAPRPRRDRRRPRYILTLPQLAPRRRPCRRRRTPRPRRASITTRSPACASSKTLWWGNLLGVRRKRGSDPPGGALKMAHPEAVSGVGVVELIDELEVPVSRYCRPSRLFPAGAST